MSEYRIVQVSSKPPKTWTGKFGPMETYKIMVDGETEAVEINKKPGNVPKVGDVLYGTLDETEFGIKFKADPNARPGVAASGGYRGKSPEEQDAIMRMNALTNAVTYCSGNEKATVDYVCEVAGDFHKWLRGELKVDTTPAVTDADLASLAEGGAF